MMKVKENKEFMRIRRVVASTLILVFGLNTIIPLPLARAQVSPAAGSTIFLPLPGSMVRPSDAFDPVLVKGLRVHPENPLQFDFIVDTGSDLISDDELKPHAATLIKYFLTALTVPDDELWVNLSPYEKDRIIPDNLSITDMGRDLLAQDYLLKQLTASLMYPEDGVGRDFWDRVHQKSQELFGTTEIPVDTFNKVWVVPQRAKIQLNGDVAFIVESRLKVMMEEDYLALKDNALEHQTRELEAAKERARKMQDISTKMIKDVLIPVIEEEVNHGEHFAKLRQIYHSLILATWFKQNLKQTYLVQVYVGTNKVNGIDIEETTVKEEIYNQYLEAFKKGVYNYVREEYDPVFKEPIPRQYFSGGMRFGAEIFDGVLSVEQANPDEAMIAVRENTVGQLRTLPTNINPVQKDYAILGDDTPIDLADFVRYRKLFLSDGATERDIVEAITDPKAFAAIIDAGKADRDPANIKDLITRQAPIQQSIVELISNAADAMMDRSTSIGRFGMGALQMLNFVFDRNNPALAKGVHILVDTKTATGEARQIQFFKGNDQQIKFNITKGTRTTPGTQVRIQFPKGIDPATKALLIETVEDRLNLFTKMRVNLNGRLINPLDDHIFLNGDKVHYDRPDAQIRVDINDHQIVVEDDGTGMSDAVILDKYLIPRRGENQEYDKEQTEEEINEEVHLFYKGPQRADKKSTSRLVFQIAGINIKSTNIEGYGLPRELIIQLPSSTNPTVSRDIIQVDKSTETAIIAIAQKIVDRQPIHQIALINGFMHAVKLLDAANTRVEGLAPLSETAKNIFSPFIMKHPGLILPNDELFRQMLAPPDTLYLEESLAYRISPKQIPHAKDLERSFKPGRFSKAYTVPFKADSDVTFLEAGPYLLINQAEYEKHKDQPLVLNLRLNYYRGYGRKLPARGWIGLPSAQTPKLSQRTEASPLLEEFDTLREVLSEKQALWLELFFTTHAKAAMDQRGGLGAIEEEYSGHFDAGSEDAQAPQLQARSTSRYPIEINQEIDVSPERVRRLFFMLNRFVAAMPQYMRDVVNWQTILPLQGSKGERFEEMLANPKRIFMPDAQFLDRNSTYFMNQDHPQRLQRYLKNLLQVGDRFNGQFKKVLHPTLAQINEVGLSALDAQVLTMVGDVFEQPDMQNMERAFGAINESLPYVTNDGIKRVITRWLRLYSQDPKAADGFAERLAKVYLTGEKALDLPSDYKFVRGLKVKRSAITPDGTRFVTNYNNITFVFNIETGKTLVSMPDEQETKGELTSNVVVTSDSQYAYFGDEHGQIIRRDIATGIIDRIFAGHDGEVLQMQLSADGQRLVSHGRDGFIRKWDTQTGEELQPIRDQIRGNIDITISPDSKNIIVVYGDGTFDVYFLESGIRKYRSEPRMDREFFGIASQALVTPDSQRLIFIDEDITVYDLTLKEGARSIAGWPSSFKGAAVTPDSKKLIVAMPDQENHRFDIGVIDLETLELVQIFEGHEAAIMNLTVAPNGIDLISHGADQKIKVWQLRPDAEPLKDMNQREKPAQVFTTDAIVATQTEFSADGRWFIAKNEEDNQMHQVEIYRALASLRSKIEMRWEEDNQPVSFGSSDGRHLITVHSDEIIRVTDTDTGRVVNEIVGSEIPWIDIDRIKLLDDVIVVLSTDKTAEVWDRATSTLRHHIVDLIELGPKGKYYIGSGMNLVLRETSTDEIKINFPPNQQVKFGTNASNDVLVFVTDIDQRKTDIVNLETSPQPSRVRVRWAAEINEHVQLSSDNRFMLVPSLGDKTQWDIWDSGDGSHVIHMKRVKRAKIIPGQHKAIFEWENDPYIQVIDLEDGEPIKRLSTIQPYETTLQDGPTWEFTPDGRYLVVPTEKDVIQVWDIENESIEYELNNFAPRVTISKDQKHLMALSKDQQTISIMAIATGQVIREWRPHQAKLKNVDISNNGELLTTEDVKGNIKTWSWNRLLHPAVERTGFAALAERDNLMGLPLLLRTVIRFLKEEDVTLLKQEKVAPREKGWQVTDQLDEPVSLALLNNLFELFSRKIKSKPDITFSEFLSLVGQVRGRKFEDYVNNIQSAIDGQDKTQRAWAREVGIQNPRDATRRARENGILGKQEGGIEIRNFMQGDDWIFSVRDHGMGMNLYHLIRYFFPLDESSKNYLVDTGNLGQGNYTLFADFDRVFIRTSRGDGIIHELEIIPTADQGPVIEKWEVLEGDMRGTEVRRIKNNTKSDPQLESLFIQEALQRFASAIISPEERMARGEGINIRDTKITLNGETFTEPIEMTASSVLGRLGASLSVGRAEDKFNRRVIQDGIFIKEPDGKELRFVPQWLQAAYERLGGLHIAIPRKIKPNIPRTGYAEEHEFLEPLQVGVLHNILKSVLTDYVDEGLKIPGVPSDYFDNYRTDEDPEARRIARFMHEGRYKQISLSRLTHYAEKPERLFKIMAYLPFISDAYDGPMTLHEIRERFVVKSKLRRRASGAVDIAERTRMKKDFVPRGEFALDLEESVGKLTDIADGIINGRLKRWADGQKSKTRSPQEVWDRLPPDTKLLVDYLIRRFIQPLVKEDMPYIDYYNRKDNAAALTGNDQMDWNLAYNEQVFKLLMHLREHPDQLADVLRNGTDRSPLWIFLQRLMHETQHLGLYEEPGDHTHHDEADIEGLDAKDDTRFGVRMGRGIDAFLYGLEDDLIKEFTRSPDEMRRFIAEVDQKRDIKKAQDPDSAVLAENKKEVGGIDLNPSRLQLEVDETNGPLTLPANQMILDAVPVEGFYPVILNVLPTNLPLLFGASEQPLHEPNQHLISALREEDVWP